MIEYKTGDILQENAEAIVNTVNCVGIMGRGIALQFKNTFPDNFKAYVTACKHAEVQPGHMFVYETTYPGTPRYIINFPTKRHWKDKSRIEDIEAGLKSLATVISKYNIHSIAIPPLGSGLGGLKWAQIKPLIIAALKPLKNVQIIIYEPEFVREKTTYSRKAPKMTAGRATLVQLMHRYLNALLDPFVTLLEVQKLMYFMQVAGEPLRLRYVKGLYGPYAENLRHVLNDIEGHLISGYVDGGDNPNKQLRLRQGAVEAASAFLENHAETRTRFDQVVKLVEGFESSFGLELLSTVHWIVQQESAHTLDDVVKQTYAWNKRKKQFTERQITLAAKILTQRGWISNLAD